MSVHRLDPNHARDARRFLHLPFELYKDCPQWVPPFEDEARGILNRAKHPFYRHGDAAFFLAECDGQTAGRIGVFDNRSYNEHNHTSTAFFYCFECINDAQRSRELFDAAFTWARQRGLTDILGPKGPLRADGLGLLVEGFEHRPAMGIPYNHAYYERLIMDAGFAKEHDHLSGYLPGDYVLPPRFHEIAERVKERRGFSVRTFTSKDELRTLVPGIQRIYNEAFANIWGYYPADEAEMALVADRLIAISDPRLIKLVFKGDEIAGFLFAFPDLSAAIQRCRGRLWPLGWLDLLREAKRTRWLNVNGLGLLPRYQGLGATAILYSELVKSVSDFHFEHCDVVQVAEDNVKSLGEMKAIGVNWYKRHRVYRRTL